MALPSSGQLSLNDIKTELGAASTNVSLGSMSNTAGFSEPDAISDFYGYSSVSAFSGVISNQASPESNEACGAFNPDQEVYKNGSSSTPSNFDQLYSDPTLSTNFVPGSGYGAWYKYMDIEGGNALYTIYLLRGASGECVIEAVQPCIP